VNGARAIVLLLALGACASRARYTRTGGQVPVMVVRTEAVTAVEGERVLAAADDGTRRLLLTAQGAWIFRGSSFERTPGARPFTRAALIAAADGRGTWAVGLDASGRLWRVRPGAALEEISDRYGLGHQHIRDVAAAGGRLVAFLVDDAVVIADGRRVSRFPALKARALAAGGRVVALVHPDHLETLDFTEAPAARPRRRTYPLQALAAAIDARGTLHAATARAVYRAEGGTLRLVYLADTRIRWLSAAGPRAWFADGDTLLALDEQVTVAQGASPPPAEPAAAGDGALWMIDGGRLTRIVPAQASAAEERWARLVAPTFARACGACHRPDGKAGVDLSTAAAWLEARDEIRERVLTRRTMPPAGQPISEEDRAVLAKWMREQ
jgi:mono/diheme cytochrome c family protein